MRELKGLDAGTMFVDEDPHMMIAVAIRTLRGYCAKHRDCDSCWLSGVTDDTSDCMFEDHRIPQDWMVPGED